MTQRDLLPSLIQIAESNLPQLKHEIDINGSSLYKLQAAVSELHSIVTYVVHHSIDERRRLLALASPQALAALAPTIAPAPAPAPAPVRPPVPQGLRTPLPPLDRAAPVAPSAAAAPGQVGQPVMEVSITPSGTRVVLPGAPAPIMAPPGAPIDSAMLGHEQPVLDPNDVVLPRGGQMSPETEAALSGGARNVTADPLPPG